MPRRLRPIRRWISTVRPSGRPFVTSRCLRSPVDAGSIPYSAVIQPRPLPAIQRGTDSCTDAVQITRVPPQLISAEPVAVLMNPGWIVTGRSWSAARPPLRSRAVISGRAPCWLIGSRPGLREERHVLDGADRELEEAGAGRLERLGGARAEEAVVALADPRVAEAARAEHVLDLAGDGHARADDLHTAAEQALEHRG